MGKEKSAPIVTPEFRVSYPSVFKAKKNDLNGKDEFSVQALFPKSTDLSTLKKAAELACIERWGADKKKWPANLRNPFRRMEEKAKDGSYPDGYEAGGTFMNLRTENRPCVVDQNKQEILETSKFYAGCWARASVGVYTYSQKGNNGVGFGLNHLQLVRDGATFSARPSVEAAFTAVDVGDAESDSASSVFN